MNETQTIPERERPEVVGPGRLVLVVGPSGAGKDTLIGLARQACGGDPGIVFARRVVTREASAAEDNEALSLAAFQQAKAAGEFAIDWEAHGHCYALRRTVIDDLRAGRAVVANVSRTVVEPMRQSYADVVVVAITAPPEVLAQRLSARSRSSDGASRDRLTRAVTDAAPDVTIINVEAADVHARELLDVIGGGAT